MKAIATGPLQIEAGDAVQIKELRQIADERATVPAVIERLIIGLHRRQDQRQHDVGNDQPEEAFARVLFIGAPPHGKNRRRARNEEQQRHAELIADDGNRAGDGDQAAADDEPVTARKRQHGMRQKHPADDQDPQPVEIVETFFRLCDRIRRRHDRSSIH